MIEVDGKVYQVKQGTLLPSRYTPVGCGLVSWAEELLPPGFV